MKGKKYLPYLISILIVFAVSALGSLATSRGMPAYEELIKSPLTPPSFVFPIVWSILYVLMAIGAAMIWKSEDDRRGAALTLYAVQLLCNVLWSVLFFGFGAHLAAFVLLLLLWVLVFLMVVVFYRIDPRAGLLQIPYLLWLTFAAYLNLAIWLLNR